MTLSVIQWHLIVPGLSDKGLTSMDIFWIIFHLNVNDEFSLSLSSTKGGYIKMCRVCSCVTCVCNCAIHWMNGLDIICAIIDLNPTVQNWHLRDDSRMKKIRICLILVCLFDTFISPVSRLIKHLASINKTVWYVTCNSLSFLELLSHNPERRISALHRTLHSGLCLIAHFYRTHQWRIDVHHHDEHSS